MPQKVKRVRPIRWTIGELKRMLQQEHEVICLNPGAYLEALQTGLKMSLEEGLEVKARIVKGYPGGNQ